MNPDTDDFDVVPARLAVQAMRDNGYRNAAYAAAELIDNSIQAGATSVDLLIHEERDYVKERARARVSQVAVIDNGSGMDPLLLRNSLQFGNGSHLNDRSGIGRFGMGLPSASISQCLHVDVWSWQAGNDNAFHTYVDVDQIAKGSMREVPIAERREIPAEWIARTGPLGKSGTLVVWSKLDRLMWRTGKALMDNSEFLVARMYRKFLQAGQVAIRMATYEGDASEPKHEWMAEPNDPGYLMSPSSTPAPFDNEAMFQPDGDQWQVQQMVAFQGKVRPVTVRFSFAKEAARATRNAGSTDYGRHAARNIGVSLMRADRELDMDQAFVSTSEARDRWWGVEIDFPPDLDELFGVANNKQSARNFSELASKFETLKANTRNWQDLKEEFALDDDPRGPLFDLIDLIDRRVRLLREMIKTQREGADASRKRHSRDSAEALATEATRERQGKGLVGASDAQESMDPTQRQQELRDDLIESGISAEAAEELAARTVSNGLKYLFTPATLEGRAFFTVSPRAGELVIKVNTSHPAYGNLVEVLEKEVDDNVSPDELRSRLAKAQKGLKLLLLAWARYEDEQPSDETRAETQDVRNAWGQMAYRFLQEP